MYLYLQVQTMISGMPFTLKVFFSYQNSFNNSKKESNDQESIQSSTTPDPGFQWEVTNSQLGITNESQEVSPFPAGDHKATINRHAQKHNQHTTEIT